MLAPSVNLDRGGRWSGFRSRFAVAVGKDYVVVAGGYVHAGESSAPTSETADVGAGFFRFAVFSSFRFRRYAFFK